MGFKRRKKRERGLPLRRSRREKSVPQGDCFVVRKGSGYVSDSVEGILKLEVLTHDAHSNELEAIVATAEPGASCWEAQPQGGDKWYYILEGKLEVVVNEVSYVLGEGDSIYLDSDAQHIWRNPGKRQAKALVLTSPPSAHLKRKPNESDPRK